MTNQMQDQTVKDKRQTTAWISHDLTQNYELDPYHLSLAVRFNSNYCYCPINCREFLVCIKDWLLQLWVLHQYLQSVSGDLTLVKNYSSRTLMMNQRKATKKYC